MSDRFRYRYVPRLAVATAVVAGVGLVLWLATSVLGGGSDSTAGRTTAVGDEPAQVYHAPKHVPLAAAAKRVAARFIRTVVTRDDLQHGWAVTGPALRGGLSRAEWLRGDIPVVPYPAYGGVKFKVDQSVKDDATLEVALFPRRGSSVRPQVFFLGVHRFAGRWLVNYFAPHNQQMVPTP